jgi:hypothetical protein
MAYKVNPRLRIDFSDLGDNNGTPFFVEIKNPKMMSFGEKMAFAKFAPKSVEQGITEEQINAMKDIASKLILSWNLTDEITEQPIEPTTPDALDHVPSDVVERIIKALAPTQDEETKN